MTTDILRQTASTRRPAVVTGRALNIDITHAPGKRSMVITPGTGAIGECMKARTIEAITAAASQIPVGAIVGQ
jgi:hypothetical protein